MDTISVIASVVAAIASLLTLRYTVRMSKGNIRRRIEKKERQISDINNQLIDKFGINDNGTGRPMTALDWRKRELQTEIEELRKEL